MKNTLVLLLFLPWLGEAQIIKQNIPDKLVVLTFDDASASQYSVVAPWLKEFQFEATFFICEFPQNFSDTTKYMSWRQIKTLHEMGFEVANHTQHHYNVAQLTKAKFTEELCYIENKCDSLHISKPGSFAYPGYGVNISAINTLNEKGYRFARVGGSRAYNPLSDHPLIIPIWALNAENQAEIMAALHQAQNRKIVVLTIHGVPDAEHPWVSTPPQLFRKYLNYLHNHNYKVVALRDLERYIDVEKAKATIVPDFSKPLRN